MISPKLLETHPAAVAPMLASTEVVAHFNAAADACGYTELLHPVVETRGRQDLSFISN